MRIFGREPALWLGAIGSVFTFIAALNLPYLNAGQAAAATAALTALVMAVTTRPWAPAAFTGALTAAVALLAEYGFAVSDGVVAALSGSILAVFALISRGQVSPAA